MSSNPSQTLVDHVKSINENRENAFASQTKQFESTQQWLVGAIQSCKRKILEGSGQVVADESGPKRVKSAVDNPKENNNPNATSNIPFSSKKNDQSEYIRVMALRVADLREELRRCGLDTAGRKKELQQRLLGYHEAKDTVDVKPENPMVCRDDTIAVVELSSKKPAVNVPDVEMEDVSPNESMPEKPKANVAAANDATKKSPKLEQARQKDDGDVLMEESGQENSARKSFLKSTASIFSPGKILAKLQGSPEKANAVSKSPLRSAIAQKATKTAVALFASSPSKAVPQTSNTVNKNMVAAGNDSTTIADSSVVMKEQQKPTSTGAIKESTAKVESIIKGPSSAPVIGASSVSTSVMAKQKAMADARKARLAEIRGKSKPVAMSKPEASSEKSTALNSRLLKSSSLKKGTDEKRQLLTTQMREKAAAAVKPKTLLSSTKVTASSQKILGATQPQLNKKLAASPAPKKATSPKPTGLAPRDIKAENKHKILSPRDTYEISDREGDSESDSEDESRQNRPKKRIPQWAQKKYLLQALEKQYDPREKGLNPDMIFPEVETCNLEAIFDRKKDRYKSRTSSGNWTQDRVTVTEKLVYSRSMGYAS